MRQGVITWSRPICDALVMFAVQCFTVAGILPRTQHCNNGRPTPVCYPYRPRLKYSVTRSSSMKSPRLNFHAKRARTSSSCCLSLFKEASYTQTTSAEVPVLHTPVEVAEVKWQVYHELPGVWYEIKQKQQKMPKARANITVYSSTRFSVFSLILSCLTVSFSCGIVYSRVKRTPESEKKKTYVYLIKRKIKNKMMVRIYPLLF